MSEYGSTYVRVEANSVMTMAEGGSNEGGYNVTGYYVNWTTNGITNINWTDAISAVNSPFAEMQAEEIVDIISQPEGNLDNIFRPWGATHTDEEELAFLLWAVQHYGSNRDGGVGCIGDRMY